MNWLPMLLLVGSVPDSTLLMSRPDIHGDKIVFEYGGDLWLASQDGGRASRLTSDKGFETWARFSPDGRYIAFSGQYDADNFDVYVMPTDGGAPVRLTYHPSADIVTEWADDGESVLFISRRRERYHRQLYSISLEGGLPRQLPLPSLGCVSFSPCRQKIAFNRRPARLRWRGYRGGLAPDVWIYDMEQDTAWTITDWEGMDISPIWYGDNIYFLSDRDGRVNIYRYEIETEIIHRITDHRDFDVRVPGLGNSNIIYQSGGSLWVLDLKTENYNRLIINVPHDYISVRPRYENVAKLIDWFDISPHAKRAVFSARGDIFTVPKEKGPVRNITNTEGAREIYPAWSPDGQLVAYLSDKTGEYEIYTRRADGTGEATRITYDGDSYRWPLVWSPDSRKLLYSDSKLRLFYVDIETKRETLVDTSTIRYIRSYRWSPDSRFIAYIKLNTNRYGAVYIYSVEEGKSYQVTTDLFDEDDLYFDPDGRYLYIISSRTFSPARGDFGELQVYPATQNICLITLQKETPSPFLPESDEEIKEEEKEEEDNEEIRIDFEGITERVITVPIPAGDYWGLLATENKILYLNRRNFASRNPKFDLHIYDIDKQKDRVLIKGINSYALSEDGKSVLYKSGNTYGIIEVTGKDLTVGAGRLRTTEMKLRVDPVQEWTQIFNEAWRLQGDFFYDEDMHGMDWEHLHQVYSAFLPYAADRWDINFLISEMYKELGASHMGVWGGDEHPKKGVEIGLLGVDFELDERTGFYRFKKIYQGENWDRERRAPLTEPGVVVREGEYLIKINDNLVQFPDNPYGYLQNTIGKKIMIEVNDRPRQEGARTVGIKPISLGNEMELRYLDWVETNRQKVAAATNGLIGYIHVPNTLEWGLEEFGKYFFAQLDKKGLIIDARYNAGGWSPTMFMNYLQRRPLGKFVPRVRQKYPDPPVRFHGRLVCITNEYAGSGGDMFPHYFRELGLGPLIGTRTMGSLISTWHWTLMDGGVTQIPIARFSDLKGNWLIENEGVTPDILVDNRPDLIMRGYDPQLMKAIEVIMEKLDGE